MGSPEEALVVHQHAERLQIDVALADDLVAVHPAVELLLRIVQVEGGEEPDPDGFVKLRKGPFVASRVRMSYPAANACWVSKHTRSRVALLGAVDDLADVLEPVPQIRALGRR